MPFTLFTGTPATSQPSSDIPATDAPDQPSAPSSPSGSNPSSETHVEYRVHCITSGGRGYYSTIFGGDDQDKRRRVLGVLNNDSNIQPGTARIERRTVEYGAWETVVD